MRYERWISQYCLHFSWISINSVQDRAKDSACLVFLCSSVICFFAVGLDVHLSVPSVAGEWVGDVTDGEGVGVRELYLTWSFCSAHTLPVFTSCEWLLAQQWLFFFYHQVRVFICTASLFVVTWFKTWTKVMWVWMLNLLYRTKEYTGNEACIETNQYFSNDLIFCKIIFLVVMDHVILWYSIWLVNSTLS